MEQLTDYRAIKRNEADADMIGAIFEHIGGVLFDGAQAPKREADAFNEFLGKLEEAAGSLKGGSAGYTVQEYAVYWGNEREETGFRRGLSCCNENLHERTEWG